jgi:diacylglycerol kinase (ATP)
LGGEAVSYRNGQKIIANTGLPAKLSYLAAGVQFLLSGNAAQQYRIDIDGLKLNDRYVSIMIANSPFYGSGMKPAPEARPNDGKLDVYLVKEPPKSAVLKLINDYEHGAYRKWEKYISHYQGNTAMISSGKIMTCVFDGELFFDTTIKFETIPHAVDFACPVGVLGEAE